MNQEIIVTDEYTGPNRRVYSKTLEQLEIDIKQMLKDHEERERKWLEQFKQEFMAAFPDGDVDGHCDYHLKKIKAAQAEEEFWKAAKIKVIENGVSGVFAILKWVTLMALLGTAFKFGFGPTIAKLLGLGS